MRELKQQHGDVLIFKVDEVKGEEVKAKNGRHILAEGEATGHAHAILENPNVKMFKDEMSDRLYFEVCGEDPVDLTHEEHKTQKIAPGKYEIGIVVAG